MAEIMGQVEYIWDTGDASLWEDGDVRGSFQRQELFLEGTHATRVVQVRWQHAGKTVTCPFPATVLPDRSGAVLMDEWHFQGQPKEGTGHHPPHLRVLNADGSLRLRIYPPRIDERSKSEDSWIERPRSFAERGIPFGCPASDGRYDMVVEYDWQSGQMLRWINAAPWLRY